SAAATAMYGSRATNGVVVIRTKRGTPSATPQFNLTSRVGRSAAYRLLGTRQFTTVAQVAALPYGNGATSPDPNLLSELYPSGLNITRNSLNRGLSNNDNTNTSPIYGFAYTPGVINLDSVDATGTYVRNPFNGGGNGVSNPFETFRYLRLNELTFRQIGNLNASWSALSAAQHQVSVTATGGFDRVQISGDLFSPPFLEYEGSDGFFGRTVRTEGN